MKILVIAYLSCAYGFMGCISNKGEYFFKESPPLPAQKCEELAEIYNKDRHVGDRNYAFCKDKDKANEDR